MRTCHECGVAIRGGRFRCSSCHPGAFRLMELAHQHVYWAISNGLLPSLARHEIPCVDCGVRASQYEHRDYLRPLDVEPVCRRCNKKRGPAAPIDLTKFSAYPRPHVPRKTTRNPEAA